MTEIHSNALQTIIGEFKNISPEITNAFIFEANGEIVASDGVTIDKQSKNLVAAFNCISSKAEIMGKVKTVTMQGGDRQLSISSINNRYLATVFSSDADEKVIKSLTYVLVPAVLGLVDDFSESPAPKTVEPENKRIEVPILRPQDLQHPELVSEELYPFSAAPTLPEPPVTQLMIEKIIGFFVSPDIVRVNSDEIAKWNNLYGDKKITEVHIQTLEGKALTCKFKGVKEAKGNSRGVIQMPEKILQSLQTSKGKLVMVKPVIT